MLTVCVKCDDNVTPQLQCDSERVSQSDPLPRCVKLGPMIVGHPDAPAVRWRRAGQSDVTAERPESVETGVTLDELLAGTSE